jgi:hypothetical protein
VRGTGFIREFRKRSVSREGAKTQKYAYKRFFPLLKNLVIPVFFIAFLQSCYHPSPHEAFDDMKAIEGKWVSSGSTLFKENWQVVSDTLMRGIGFSINGKDTVFKEDLKLVRKADTVWMAVQTDPEEGFVFFKMVEAGRGKWTFKNPENEYPAIIRYHLKKDTVLEAGIANIRGNKEVIFKFKKMLP